MKITFSHRSTPNRTAWLLAIVVAAGCGGDGLGRREISGSVQFARAPLDQGSIQFSPQATGVSAGAVIEAGSYRIDAEKGLPPGTYLVRIFSPVEGAAPEPTMSDEGEAVLVPGPTAAPSTRGPSQPPPGTERIPAEYNLESTQVVEVTADGNNVFDFDIPAS